MKSLLFLLAFSLFCCVANAQKIRITEPVHFLALGDSYTIGQSVTAGQRWPAQFAAALSNSGYAVDEVKIIAQTGWRTDDLQRAIQQQQPLTGFNLVSLLIGVNNQFQGGSIQTYAQQFEDLLRAAISFAGNIPEHVFVLSIPDYAYTPYGKQNAAISNQIDQFNAVNKSITENYKVRYIDITPISRNGINQPELVATDGLHPSGIMYGLWVQEIMKSVEKELGIESFPVIKNEINFNLSQGELNINNLPGGVSFFMYNTIGLRVLDRTFHAVSEATINVSSLKPGIYFVNLIRNNNVIYRKKIVLN